MVLMAILCIVVALGIVAIWRWGNLDVVVPWDPDSEQWPLSPGQALSRFVWYVTVWIVAALTSGLVMIGAGGRLVMRLLGATAGDPAQGRLTEADQVVGDITLDGTLGFVAFFGILGGLVFGLGYLIVRRWLPGGWWRGFTYGLLLLILAATRLDPLRSDNPDFDIVGPGWLSVTAYVALGLAYGMLVAAIAGRFSRSLPQIDRHPRTLAKYGALILLAPLWVVVVPVVVAGGLGLLFTRAEGGDRLVTSARMLMAGRVLGIALAAVALPGFIIGIADIATRP